jgi:hypothetical protein
LSDGIGTRRVDARVLRTVRTVARDNDPDCTGGAANLYAARHRTSSSCKVG